MFDIDASIAAFSDRLHGAGDFSGVRAAVQDHVSGSFVPDFLCAELGAIAENSDHIVRRVVGQVSFTLINTTDFEYTVRLAPAFAGQPKRRKWLGERQIVCFRGPGVATVRILRVPPEVEINAFRTDVVLEEMPTRTLRDGEIVEVADGHSLLDIVSITTPMIFEIVTARARDVELYWTFDESGKSVYAELAALSASRLRNIIEVAHRMGKTVPISIYDRLVADRNTQIKLLAIQSMLVERHPDALHTVTKPGQEVIVGRAAGFGPRLGAR